MTGGTARTADSRDGGFTLIELLVTLSLIGVMTGLAMTSFTSWSSSSQHRGARDQVVSTLRNAGERALSEGRTYCVAYSGAAWTTYRKSCGPAGLIVAGPTTPESSRETFTGSLVAPSGAESACPSGSSCAYFYPRGNASAGTVTVARTGKPSHTVTIVGLTSRVYAS